MGITTGILLGLSVAFAGADAGALDIGTRLEPMVDSSLIAGLKGQAKLTLHPPIAREVVMEFDKPWEGNSSNYFVVFRDGDVIRMWYRGSEQTLKDEPAPHEMVTCYAESKDGIHWERPNLGLFEFNGSKDNNIIWTGETSHDLTPFKDENPNCAPEGRYKSVGNDGGKLMAFQSPDGIHWTQLNDKQPVMTTGAFDTQNVAFWDTVKGEYRAYVRDFRDGLRDIRTATSQDFIHWTEPVWCEYPGSPKEQLYTNQVIPYYRAPHIYLGFPTRYTDRGWVPGVTDNLPELELRRQRFERAYSPREGTAVTDGLFMSSRDGQTFHRWSETFIRPGLRTKDNWAYGDNYQAWGIVETPSHLDPGVNELSVYATESYVTGTSCTLRRYTLRIDGFASVHAPLGGGEFITRPMVCSGNNLALNFSTSAGGSITIEVMDQTATPIEGYKMEDSPVLFGDSLEQVVAWKDGKDLSSLKGQPVMFRFALKEADIYAIRFKGE